MLRDLLSSVLPLDPAPWVATDDNTCCERATVQAVPYLRFLPRADYAPAISLYPGALSCDPLPYLCLEHQERYSRRGDCSEHCTVLLLPRCGFITAKNAYEETLATE
jgi:hypothetical protein